MRKPSRRKRDNQNQQIKQTWLVNLLQYLPKLKDWQLSLPKDEAAVFYPLIISTNLRRMRVVALFLILTMLLLILSDLSDIDRLQNGVSFETEQIYTGIITIRLCIILISLCFLFVVRNLDALEKRSRYFHKWQIGFILSIFTGLSLHTGISQPLKADITVYLMAVFICSAFLYLSGRESIIIYSTAWLVMAVTVWIFQANTSLALANIINGFIMGCLALFVSKMICFNRLQEFMNLRVIEQQQEELQRSNAQLERLSYRDALTDLPNRRYFDDYISREWRMAARENEPLSLIIFDIDYFKQFNDTFGHLAGDECLTTVASTLNKILKRPCDLLVRYGGEEFVVVLPKTKLPEARYLAEIMRSTIAELQIEHPYSASGYLTISLGVAESYPTWENAPGILIAAADEAMYQAKKAGRNQVCSGLRFSFSLN